MCEYNDERIKFIEELVLKEYGMKKSDFVSEGKRCNSIQSQILDVIVFFLYDYERIPYKAICHYYFGRSVAMMQRRRQRIMNLSKTKAKDEMLLQRIEKLKKQYKSLL